MLGLQVVCLSYISPLLTLSEISSLFTRTEDYILQSLNISSLTLSNHSMQKLYHKTSQIVVLQLTVSKR